jgi:hypothetical protein
MAVPPYLQPSFNFLETPGVVDVATTITRIIAQALALGWTNPAAGTIVSPANAVGQQITLVFTDISPTNLEMVFTDSLGRTFTRRAQTPASFTERLYLNTFGLFWDPGNSEGLWASIMDLSPELQNCHDQWAVGHGTRNSGDAGDGTWATDGAMQLDSATPRVYQPVLRTIFSTRGAGDNVVNVGYSQTGSRMWYPVVQEGPVVATTHRIRGIPYQLLYVSGAETPQTEFVVPLDQATTGLFKVLAFPIEPTIVNFRFAVRKA